jgi:hypothetical protein
VDTKCTTLGTRGLLFQASLFLTSSKHAKTHSGWQEPETDHRNSLNVDKLIHFHLRNALDHTGDSQWMLSISQSVKLVPYLQWTASFRNTINYGVPWNTREGNSFLQRFSEGQKTTPFIHGIEDLKSEQLKAFPQFPSNF